MLRNLKTALELEWNRLLPANRVCHDECIIRMMRHVFSDFITPKI